MKHYVVVILGVLLSLVQGFIPSASSRQCILPNCELESLTSFSKAPSPTLRRQRQRDNRDRFSRLALKADSSKEGTSVESRGSSLLAVASLAAISVFYWYLMVLGAAAQSAGFPFIPDWLPMTPGWPPSDADLVPAIEDSIHFFYLSDLLGSADSSLAQPPVLRLALFNLAEAWIFAFLPVLWSDRQRLPRPVLQFTWVGALGLTNAFLAPYLLFSEVFAAKSSSHESVYEKNRIVSIAMGIIASLVVSFGAFQVATETSMQDFADFGNLVTSDRTYLAFCVDLVLFSIFQPMLLSRVKEQESALDKVPFVGLMAWLFQP